MCTGKSKKEKPFNHNSIFKNSVKEKSENAEFDKSKALKILTFKENCSKLNSINEKELFLISNEVDEIITNLIFTASDIINLIQFNNNEEIIDIAYNIYLKIKKDENLLPMNVSNFEINQNLDLMNKLLENNILNLKLIENKENLNNKNIPIRFLEIMIETISVLNFFLKEKNNNEESKKWWINSKKGSGLNFLSNNFIDLVGKIKFEIELQQKNNPSKEFDQSTIYFNNQVNNFNSKFHSQNKNYEDISILFTKEIILKGINEFLKLNDSNLFFNDTDVNISNDEISNELIQGGNNIHKAHFFDLKEKVTKAK